MVKPGVIAFVVIIGDSYDNVLAERVIEYLKESLTGVNDIELATLKLVDWFNKDHLHSAIGYISSFEFEERY